MTVQETIQALEADGWHAVFEDEQLKQFRHEQKDGMVTVSGRMELRLPPAVLRSLLIHAQLKAGE